MSSALWLVLMTVGRLASPLPQSFGLPPSRSEVSKVLGRPMPDPLFSFAIFADTQYGTAKPSGMRYYRLSLDKMKEMAGYIMENEKDLSFIMHLGDLTQDKAGYREAVLKHLPQAVRVYHVLGNHDFKGAGSVDEVLKGFGLKERRYVIDDRVVEEAGFRFLVVDATEVSTFGTPKGSKNFHAAVEMSNALKKQKELHWETHNGAVGSVQLAWLEAQLRDACSKNLSVVIFAHSPLLTGARNNDMHTWDRSQLLSLLSKYRCSRAWINGHVHVHRHVTYHVDNGHFLHLWTVSGMVQTVNSSFTIVDVYRDKLFARGVSWGTSFFKSFNLTSPLGDHSYDYNFSSHYLSRTHLSSPGAPNADIRVLWPKGSPPPVPAVTLLPSGKAAAEQVRHNAQQHQLVETAASRTKSEAALSTRASSDSFEVRQHHADRSGDAAGTHFIRVLSVFTVATPVVFVLVLFYKKRSRRA